MEKPITKDALQNEIYCGQQAAIELLYARYGGMLYGFILQLTPSALKAEDLLVAVFSRLAPRLQEACDSRLSIYCWLQVEATRIIRDAVLENKNDMEDDLEILEYLKNLKLKGIRYLCSKYGEGMTIVASRLLGDTDKAKDVVYETFWKLWVEKKYSDVTPPLRPFLYKEIRKACLV